MFEVVDVTVGDEEFGVSIEIGIEKAGTEAEDIAGGLFESAGYAAIFPRATRTRLVPRVCFAEEIGDDEIGYLVGIEVSGGDAHAAFCPALSTHSQPGDEAAILPRGGVGVPCEQSVGCGIVGDKDFGARGLVCRGGVHDKNSESFSGVIGFGKICGVVVEGTGFVIEQQEVGQRGEDGGKAHGGLSETIVTEPGEDIRSTEVGDEKQIGH